MSKAWSEMTSLEREAYNAGFEAGKAARPEEGSREAKLEEALKHILWIKDCGIDGRDEIGVFRNWPEQERDEMYKIAQDALGMNKERS